jgi:hypothetical protein
MNSMIVPLLFGIALLGGNPAQRLLESALSPYRHTPSLEMVYSLDEYLLDPTKTRNVKRLTSLRFKVVLVRNVGWIAQDAGSITDFPHSVYMLGKNGYAIYEDGRKFNLEQVTLAADTGILCHPMALVQGKPVSGSARFGPLRTWMGEAVSEVQVAKNGYSYFISKKGRRIVGLRVTSGPQRGARRWDVAIANQRLGKATRKTLQARIDAAEARVTDDFSGSRPPHIIR